MAINRYYRSNNSYGRNSQAARIAAENARIQRINSYRSQIGAAERTDRRIQYRDRKAAQRSGALKKL